MKIEIPEFHRLHLRLGTCSWKYDSWKGLFYDPARKYRADDYRVGFVYLEGHYMPPIGDVFEKYTPAPADTCVIRLHGGDRLEIEKETGEIWNRIVAPKSEGIEAAAKIVAHNTEKGIRTFLNVNNHYEGSAPLTIERFLEALAR